MPLSTRFSMTPVAGSTPTSFHVSLRCVDGQRAEIPLDERLHRRQIEAADEDEREVARIGEAILVERERLVEIHLIDHLRRHHARARVVLGQRRLQRLAEREFRRHRLLLEPGLQLRRHHAEHRGIGPRLRERQVDQLEHRFQILARAAARQPFIQLADDRPDGRGLPGERLAQIDGAELADAAGDDRMRGGAGRDEVLIARERGAAGADRAEEDLVLLERRRLEHDLHAVGQLPLGDAVGLLRRRLDDRAGRGHGLEQRLVVHRVDVGRQRLAGCGGDRRRELRLVRHRHALLLGRADERRRGCDPGVQSFARRVDLGERDLGQEPLIQAVLVDDARDRLVLEEVADVTRWPARLTACCPSP